MPATDEDLLRDLMHRATGDLHAPAGVTAGIITTARRQHRRNRALGLGVTGAAAATAIGVATAAAGSAGAGRHGHGSAIQLTAAQRTLSHLSASAASASPPAGRYVKMTELAGKQPKTTIIDTRTGNVWTYQPGIKNAPAKFFTRAGMPTEAQLDAYPTRVDALRKFLIAQAEQQQARALRRMQAQLKAAERKHPGLPRKVIKGSQPKETSDDWAFSQAAYTLWNPAISPALRSALFKVIAHTPGVKVNSHATDSRGRKAVEISRYDAQADYTESVFESPDATGVLETSSLEPARPAEDGLPAQKPDQLNDTFLSIRWSATRPSA